jgi:OOP family OmpA-OmpF porin
MKKFTALLFASAGVLLGDAAFPYIQPVSLEVAPLSVTIQKSVEKVVVPEVKQEPKKQVEKKNEADSDGDGVVDSQDQCPNTPKMFKVDTHGCPATATLHINFASNAADITDELMEKVKDFAEFLKQNDSYDIVILGYTDSTGIEQNNLTLSQKRADAVKEALKRDGISTARMTSLGKGAADPVGDNSTPEGRAENRRIEIQFIQ